MLDFLVSIVRFFYPWQWAIIRLTDGTTLYGMIRGQDGMVVRVRAFDPRRETVVESVLARTTVSRIDFTDEEEVRLAFVRADAKYLDVRPCMSWVRSWVEPSRCRFCSGLEHEHKERAKREQKEREVRRG